MGESVGVKKFNIIKTAEKRIFDSLKHTKKRVKNKKKGTEWA